MKNVTKSIISSVLMLVATTSFGAGFTILDQTAAGAGRALAGITADTSEPASLFFNPSTTAWFDNTQITVGNHIMHVDATFENHGSSAGLGTNESGNQGGWVMIPNLYMVHPLSDRISFGFGASATSGTRTDYSKYWIGRYTATETEIMVMDVTPSLSIKINDELSFGVGILVEYASATMGQMINLSAYGMKDARMEVNGDGAACGFTTGLLYRPFAKTRIGLGYRSRMQIDLELDNEVKGANALKSYGLNVKTKGEAELNLPSMVNFGIIQELNDSWNVMAEVSWSAWYVMNELTVFFDDPLLGQTSNSQEMKWRNNWRLALGTEYKFNDKFTFRTGLAFDETPTVNKYRNTRLPDADRYWIAAGFAYQATEHVRLDCGLTHIIFASTGYKQASPVPGESEMGFVKGKERGCFADILSISLTYSF